MPLELTDFDQRGLSVDCAALFVAAAAPSLYMDADRGGTQSPEAGELGIGAGETRISGIRLLTGNRIALLDSNQPTALSLSDWFGSSGTSRWTLYIQTDDGTVSTDQVQSAGGDVVRMQFASADAAVLNGIAANDRVILAVALTPPQPRAALAASEASVERGRSVELRWTAAHAVEVTLSPGLGPVAPVGSVRVRPETSTTYLLTARGAAGTTPAVASVTVAVTARAAFGAGVSLLPPNATALERAMERAGDRPIDLPIRKLWSAADCPVDLLPYLAWALGVEEWDSEWPGPVKRAAVAGAFAIHREKGTLAGLRRLLDAAGAEYEYTERPEGQPMTALLAIGNSNAVFLPDIARAIERVKRASLHLDLVLTSAAAGQIPVAGGLGAATVAEIGGLSGYAA